MKKYSWSFDHYADIWENTGETIEECIRQAKEYNPEKLVVYIGENDPVEIPSIDHDWIIERIRELMVDEINYEVMDGWPEANNEELKILNGKLNDVFREWCAKSNVTTEFWKIKNVEQYTL